MSQPTPGSDPNYPQGGAPQGQPGWGAPQNQPQGYGAPQGYNAPGAPSGYGDAVARPSQVTAAAIIGIVIGGLGSLFGLISLFGIGIVFAFDPILGLLALLSIATAVVVLIGGIQALQGKSPRAAAPGQLRLDRRPAAVPDLVGHQRVGLRLHRPARLHPAGHHRVPAPAAAGQAVLRRSGHPVLIP